MTKIKSHLLPGDDAYAGEFYETAPKIEADKELDEIIPHISGLFLCWRLHILAEHKRRGS